ncbi:MAG: preprotein translocase subunit SecG [Candidatus Dasytiphilus stammeri]
MYEIIFILFFLIAINLIILILIQQGNNTNMGSINTGASNTFFGSSGAGNFLIRITAVLAILFILTSMLLDNVNFLKKKTKWDNLTSSAKIITPIS